DEVVRFLDVVLGDITGDDLDKRFTIAKRLTLADTLAPLQFLGGRGIQRGHILKRGLQKDHERRKRLFPGLLLPQVLQQAKQPLIRRRSGPRLGILLLIVSIGLFEKVVENDLERPRFPEEILAFFGELQHTVFLDILFEKVFQQYLADERVPQMLRLLLTDAELLNAFMT